MGIFILYSLLGALLLSCYEPEMNFFKAVYFNFITLTSIGLGDVIPKSEAFLWLTLIYIAVGLALTTIAIGLRPSFDLTQKVSDLAADYLKRLHYYGRKIENVGAFLGRVSASHLHSLQATWLFGSEGRR